MVSHERGHAAAALAALALLVAPAATGAASFATDEAPAARLVASPAVATAGEPVELRVAASPRHVVRYVWTTDGGSRTTVAGSLRTTFGSPGVAPVEVELVHRGGLTETLHSAVTVRAAQVARPPRPPAHRPERRVRPVARRPSAARTPLTVIAAAAASVTIRDFSFQAATTTIHVGDSVTWTNLGPSEHTATATGGSFDTGVLRRGQSATHTFTTAGTFQYMCSIHPFMRGTVVVQGASSSPSTSPSPAGSTSTPSSGASASSAPAQASTGSTLPLTGLDLLPVVLAGALLLSAGSVLRRRLG
jgi:plastocyanin